MSDDLIKRLERANEYEPLGHDGWEAAAALAEAQAEIARLESELAVLRAKVEWLQGTALEAKHG